MIYNRDYILRMIEQMGAVLIAIRNSILGRVESPAQIEDKLRGAASQVGMDLTVARAATPETIRMLVAPMGDVEPGRCWMVAELLYLDGLHAELEERRDQAIESFEKALPLYHILAPGAQHLELPEALERIDEIEGRLVALEAGRERESLAP